MTETATSLEELDGNRVPLLIYKTGTIGDVPLDFLPSLAEVYEAAYVSSDEIRKELRDRDIAEMGRTRNQKNYSKPIKRIGQQRITNALTEGNDVVYNLFQNKAENRAVMADIAYDTGALTLALVVHTPLEVVFERVSQWIEEDAFTIPVRDWDISPLHIARMLINYFEQPQPSEDIDYIVELNGAQTTRQLHDQFGSFLIEHDLDDTE